MPEACSKCTEVEKDVQTLSARLDSVEHSHTRMKEAFPQNELGLPDYDGHRQAHRRMVDADKLVDGYKADATKKVVGWGLAGALALLASGALEHLKAWVGK